MSDADRTLDLLRLDAIADAVRDDLAEARRERNMYRLLYLAALDGLSLVATAPERYEQIQRDLLNERQAYMAKALRERVA